VPAAANNNVTTTASAPAQLPQLCPPYVIDAFTVAQSTPETCALAGQTPLAVASSALLPVVCNPGDIRASNNATEDRKRCAVVGKVLTVSEYTEMANNLEATTVRVPPLHLLLILCLSQWQPCSCICHHLACHHHAITMALRWPEALRMALRMALRLPMACLGGQ
jgi:hypothetical protein